MKILGTLVNSPSGHNWIAIFVSVIALLMTITVSFIQYCQTKNHNMKSLAPLVNVFMFNNDTSGFKVQNVGLGPAVISGVRVRDTSTDYWFTKWAEFVGIGLEYAGEDFLCADTTDSAQAIGVERPLINLPQKQQFIKNDRFDVQVCYCSVYDQCWVSSFLTGIKDVDSCEQFSPKIEC